MDPATNPRVRAGDLVLDWGPAVQRLARARMGMTVTAVEAVVTRIGIDGTVYARERAGGGEYRLECWSR